MGIVREPVGMLRGSPVIVRPKSPSFQIRARSLFLSSPAPSLPACESAPGRARPVTVPMRDAANSGEEGGRSRRFRSGSTSGASRAPRRRHTTPCAS